MTMDNHYDLNKSTIASPGAIWLLWWRRIFLEQGFFGVNGSCFFHSRSPWIFPWIADWSNVDPGFIWIYDFWKLVNSLEVDKNNVWGVSWPTGNEKKRLRGMEWPEELVMFYGYVRFPVGFCWFQLMSALFWVKGELCSFDGFMCIYCKPSNVKCYNML